MKTVHLFDDMVGVAGTERQQRVYRSGKVLYSLAAKTGSKINPATVWVDAAMSCIDAINAYLRLQRAKEVTRQLEMIRDSLEIRLKDQNEILNIYLDDIEDERVKRLENLDRYFYKAGRKSDIFIGDIEDNKDEILKFCRTISDMRHTGCYSKELGTLIKVNDDLVFATLNALNKHLG
jgi:hypothetical protein